MDTAYSFRRLVDSKRNQARRSASSIQFSEQACARDIAVLVAKVMRLAQARHQLSVVVAQLGEHIQGRDEIGVVVHDALQAADVADRAQRRAADLANALGDCVRGGEAPGRRPLLERDAQRPALFV